jgi:hypothetical protein
VASPFGSASTGEQYPCVVRNAPSVSLLAALPIAFLASCSTSGDTNAGGPDAGDASSNDGTTSSESGVDAARDAASDAAADADAGPTFAGAWPGRASKLAVTPIYESGDSPNAMSDLQAMRAELGPDGAYASLGFSASTFYCGELAKDMQGQWHHDPTRLYALFDTSQKLGVPFVLHVNGGHWCGGGLNDAQSAFNMDKNIWRGDQIAWAIQNGGAPAPYEPPPSTGPDIYYASYSRLFDETDPTTYRYWKKRVVTEIAQQVVSYFAKAGRTPLLAGASLDSETRYAGSPVAMDYNPTFVAEWREFMAATGIYGPKGPHAGQGRQPALALSDFNAAFGTSYATWDAVQPPASPGASPAQLWHEWNRFRIEAERHWTQDIRDWLVAGGLPPELVYNHQVPQADWFWGGDDLETAQLDGSGTGITTYGTNAIDTNLYARTRAVGTGHWGIFEHNPLDCGVFATDQARDTAALLALKQSGADILCPYAWPKDPNFPNCQYGGIAISGTPYAKALTALLADGSPRPPYVDPSSPGTLAYRLFDHFAGAVAANSPDTHAAPAATCGGVALDSIFEHPPLPASGSATLTFPQVALPQANRLVFVTRMGFADGAGFGGDGVVVTILVGGQAVAAVGIGVEDTWWHRWRPLVVDVTSFAGQTKDVALQVNAGANNTYDWLLWGDPGLYVVK